MHPQRVLGITLLVIVLGLAGLITGCVGMPWDQTTGAHVDDVQISLWVSHHSVEVGQPLQMRLTAHNSGSQTAVFQSENKPVLQVFATGRVGSTGQSVWGPEWPGEGKLTPQLTRLELKPGETKTIVEMTWTPDEQFQGALMWVGGVFWYGTDAESRDGFAVPVTIGFVYSPFP